MPLPDGIALLTQAVAQTGRRLLASNDETLPEAEPSVDWRGLDGSVLVLAHRSGRVEGRITPPRHPSDVGINDAGVRLVARALDSAVAGGVRLVFPDSLPVDSISWSLHLEAAVLSEKGEITVPKIRTGSPIFSVLVPAERQVAAERVRVSYPPRLRSAGFMGQVVMQFVVDTTGRVDRATIRDLFPAGAAALDAEGRPIYDEFVRSIRQALVTARYRPARVGGCLVRQLVQQPFQFKLGDGRWPSP
jgi:TonB family protein